MDQLANEFVDHINRINEIEIQITAKIRSLNRIEISSDWNEPEDRQGMALANPFNRQNRRARKFGDIRDHEGSFEFLNWRLVGS